MSYTNADGLYIITHEDQGALNTKGGANHFSRNELIVDFDLTDLSVTPSPLDAFIPAGSFITAAYIVVTEAAAGGTSVNFGLYQQDGTVIDADGIDAAVATAALGATSAVVCDGALVGGTAQVGSNDAYFGAAATGTYTAGKGKLVIEFI